MTFFLPKFLISVAVCSAACAQVPQPQQDAGPQTTTGTGGPQMVRRMRPASPPPAFVGDTAQVAMDLSRGLPVVEVKIAGRPYRFIVDTGTSGHGRIVPALARTLGLTAIGQVLSGDPSGRTQTRSLYRIDELELGGLRLKGLEVGEVSLPPGRSQDVDGILGIGAFESHLLTFDYPRSSISLSRGALPPGAMTYTLNQRGVISVPLSVGGETIEAHVDTGNSIGALIVPTALAERLPRVGAPRRAGKASTPISSVDVMEADTTAIVRLGNVTLPVSKIKYPSLGAEANIGSMAFASSVLRIDQRNKRLDISMPNLSRNKK